MYVLLLAFGNPVLSKENNDGFLQEVTIVLMRLKVLFKFPHRIKFAKVITALLINYIKSWMLCQSNKVNNGAIGLYVAHLA